MTQPQPPFAFFMGGEQFADMLNMTLVVHGAGAIIDNNWPLYVPPPDVANGADGGDNDECSPNTVQFIADSDKPVSFRDYPTRQCAATGYWGAAHAMVVIDGQWYLRAFAPDSRSNKKYPPIGSI